MTSGVAGAGTWTDHRADRSWTQNAIRLIEADATRSADTHLVRLDLPPSWDIQLYLKDESTHASGSLKHRLARSLFLFALVGGQLRPGMRAYDVLRATFPAGTLSGAPKPRAMELIEHYEGSRRGVYGGVVGYIDFHGDLDMAIAIRTAVLRDRVAHVQAGAGIVADSDPVSEHRECVAKATAALRAVATAEAMRPITGTEGSTR